MDEFAKVYGEILEIYRACDTDRVYEKDFIELLAKFASLNYMNGQKDATEDKEIL